MARKKQKRPGSRCQVIALASVQKCTASRPVPETRQDGPPKIRCDRGEIEVLRKGYRHRYENQLDKLYELTKGKKTGLRRYHIEVGHRLARDFVKAGIDTMAMMDLEKWMSGGGGAAGDGLRPGEKQAQARKAFRVAMKAVGPTSARILYAVCCENMTVTDYCREWDYGRDGMGTRRLRDALEDLAIHYGVVKKKVQI